MVLTGELGRPLDIHQGKASRILTGPADDGDGADAIDLGGRVEPVGQRRL
ncbi:hypothetical protein HNR23_004113 [Nocardiopsis mwathae]|uniref:Uncharacterized protein n=1 Tax=Nocardiopsis mwathae TaxID=1472723 RepID=A0A7W9YKX2_9ACTN|nr:hypothetical protein [Nocardiopsis mwathae]MBB6174053.1 hypothetical protein [Nocardiopsis mwathae]